MMIIFKIKEWWLTIQNIINPKLEPHIYKITSMKKKLAITKLRTNSHDLHSKVGRWTTLTTPWDKRFVSIVI